MDSVRLDKWLWAVRLFKTRSQSAEACRGGKVKISGENAKPSREIKAGDMIEVQLPGIRKTVEVLVPAHNRVSAKLVPELMADHTPPDLYERLEFMHQMKTEQRDRGAGRPTKRERRDIDRIKNTDQ